MRTSFFYSLVIVGLSLALPTNLNPDEAGAVQRHERGWQKVRDIIKIAKTEPFPHSNPPPWKREVKPEPAKTKKQTFELDILPPFITYGNGWTEQERLEWEAFVEGHTAEQIFRHYVLEGLSPTRHKPPIPKVVPHELDVSQGDSEHRFLQGTGGSGVKYGYGHGFTGPVGGLPQASKENEEGGDDAAAEEADDEPKA